MQRSIVGAPGMSYAAASYYQRLFKKVFDSADWQKYRKKKSLMGSFLKACNCRTTGRKSVISIGIFSRKWVRYNIHLKNI